VRAAGTVIRTTSDSVNIHLIDDRFARPQVQRLLPKRWRIGNFPSGVNSATP
jgi:DNA excision repair protein ERCC-2